MIGKRHRASRYLVNVTSPGKSLPLVRGETVNVQELLPGTERCEGFRLAASGQLLHCYRLGEIPRLIDIGASKHGDVIGE